MKLHFFKDINALLHSKFEEEQLLKEIIKKLSLTTNSNVILVDLKGRLIQEFLIKDFSLTFKDYITNKVHLEEQVLNQIDTFKSLKLNITLDNLCTALLPKVELKKYYATFYPIKINGYKIATLIIYKKEAFKQDLELILQYIEPIISLILHYKNIEKANKSKIDKNIVKSAIGTLSYSELDAIIHIFDEMDKEEGLIIASKIADKFNITRSVIVNALRKFESAGIFETRSLGMKGTYIKVINTQFLYEIKKFRKLIRSNDE